MNKYVYLIQCDKGIRVFSSYKKAHDRLINDGYHRTYDDGIIAKFEKQARHAVWVTKYLIN